MVEIMVTVILIIWFILSILNQFHRGRWIRRVKRYDVLGIIPVWTFFAPNPGRTDYYLLYRDFSSDGTISPWHEIDVHSKRRFRAIWSSSRRVGKAIGDLHRILLRPRSKDDPYNKSRLIEVYYILLLNFILKQPRDFRAEKRQFMIAETKGFDFRSDPQILLISHPHRFE